MRITAVANLVRPRWAKVFSDLAGNVVRSALVIASIAVGLFAVGMIATLHGILTSDMVTGYRKVNPANVNVTVSDFDRKQIDSIRNISGVAEAEAVRTFSLRMRSGTNEWMRISIKSIPDIEETKINRVTVLSGQWPPSDREIFFDLHKLNDAHIREGDTIEVMLADGTMKRLKYVGTVRDQTIGAGGAGGYFTANLQGYINFSTLEWLDQPELVNQIYATVEGDPDNLAHIETITDEVIDKVEQNNHLVVNQFSRRQDQHPNKVYIDAISGTLFALGFLVVFLSAFLITNTLNALLNQQLEQIGVMKTLGGKRSQIITIYLVLILIYSAIALIISLSLSSRAAYTLLAFLAREVNFNLQGHREVPLAIFLQVAIAAVVPLAAGFFPILRGAMLTIQEAFNGSGKLYGHGRTAWMDFFMSRLHLPRPLLLSLRNTFRRKGRLALTLVTLTLGGAIFIATFSVQTSMHAYIRAFSRYFVADLNLVTDRLYRMEDIRIALQGIPEVKYVEGWAGARAEILKDNDKPGESVNLLGPPVDSPLIEPMLLQGRWIVPGDQNAIVLNEAFINNYPHLKIGDTIRLRVNGDDTDWIIVGFFQFAGKPAGFLAYTNYDYLAKLIHQPGKAYSFHIVAKTPLATIEEQKALGQKLETYLDQKGYQVNDISPGFSLLHSASGGLDVLVIFLVIMAMLAAIVGSIGLTGTLSMNVLDRTREIGLLRAIGASNRAIMQQVIIEGLTIGFISWILGSLLAFPISKALWAVISVSLFGTDANFTLNPMGFLLWIGVVAVLTILASVMPAVNAARLTIREALAYE